MARRRRSTPGRWRAPTGLGLALAGLVGLGPATPAWAASVSVLPPSGTYAATQRVDIVVLIENLAGAGIAGGQVLLDDQDVTAAVLACGTMEPVGADLAFRCPGVSAGALGLGHHLFQVTIHLSDQSTVQSGAIWHVLRVDP